MEIVFHAIHSASFFYKRPEREERLVSAALQGVGMMNGHDGTTPDERLRPKFPDGYLPI
jgi:hypothetical protein